MINSKAVLRSAHPDGLHIALNISLSLSPTSKPLQAQLEWLYSLLSLFFAYPVCALTKFYHQIIASYFDR